MIYARASDRSSVSLRTYVYTCRQLDRMPYMQGTTSYLHPTFNLPGRMAATAMHRHVRVASKKKKWRQGSACGMNAGLVVATACAHAWTAA